MLDFSYSPVSSLRFEVRPGQAKPDAMGAKISCAKQAHNGSILNVSVELLACDTFGNPVEIDPTRCHLEAESMMTRSIVARTPLAAGAGQQQQIEVCVIEPTEAGGDEWPEFCMQHGCDPASIISLLSIIVVHVDSVGDARTIGEVDKLVHVVAHPNEVHLSARQIDDEVLGLSDKRVTSFDDLGAHALGCARKLRAEVSTGVVHCYRASRDWPLPSDALPRDGNLMPLTRYFHVVNVHLRNGEDNILMEYARTRTQPFYSHDARLAMISSKFAPRLYQNKRKVWAAMKKGLAALVFKDAALFIQRLFRRRRLHSKKAPSGQSTLALLKGARVVEKAQSKQARLSRRSSILDIDHIIGAAEASIDPAYIAAARAAVTKALQLDDVHIECHKSSYRTEHVRARSKYMPQLLSVYVLHHIEATVSPITHPITRRDFFIKYPAPLSFDSFFIWQPAHLIEPLLAERRQQLLSEVRDWETGATHESREVEISVTMGQERLELLEFLKVSKGFLSRPGAAGIKHRARIVRKIVEKLLTGAKTVALQVLQRGSGVMRLMATYTGKEGARASILLVGSQQVVEERYKQFKELENEVRERGDELSSQLVGPGEPVQLDDYFWASMAPIRGGMWELPEYAHAKRIES